MAATAAKATASVASVSAAVRWVRQEAVTRRVARAQPVVLERASASDSAPGSARVVHPAATVAMPMAATRTAMAALVSVPGFRVPTAAIAATPTAAMAATPPGWALARQAAATLAMAIAATAAMLPE